MTTADMWFDPICPWSWLTSRWLLEVEQVRNVQARFHVMSLSVLNEGRADPTKDRADPTKDRANPTKDRMRSMRESWWGPVRVATATELSYGPLALRDFYIAIGALIHADRLPINRDLYALALFRSGLPHTLANAASTTFYDDAVRTSHRAGVDPAGRDVGSPIIHLCGAAGRPVAFFGPVVSPHPRDEAAGRLWDAIVLAAGTDGFFELKRSRTAPPVLD